MIAHDSEMQKQMSSVPAYECYTQGKNLYFQRPWTHVEKRLPTAMEHPTPGPDTMPMPSYIGTQVMNSAIVHRPAWSFRQRIKSKISHYPAGPASHNTQNLKAKGGIASTPAYTLRIKPTEHQQQEIPGPASYRGRFKRILPKAPAFSFRRKPRESSIFKTPAPNEYTVPTIFGHHKTPPAHVMGYRLNVKNPLVTPGPGYYSHENFNKILPSFPTFTIREKIYVQKKEGTPGPGSYCPDRVIVNLPMAPKPSLGIKHSPYSGIWNPRIVGPRFC